MSLHLQTIKALYTGVWKATLWVPQVPLRQRHRFVTHNNVIQFNPENSLWFPAGGNREECFTWTKTHTSLLWENTCAIWLMCNWVTWGTFMSSNYFNTKAGHGFSHIYLHAVVLFCFFIKSLVHISVPVLIIIITSQCFWVVIGQNVLTLTPDVPPAWCLVSLFNWQLQNELNKLQYLTESV